MIMENMSHFKQPTTYAIPFILITWLKQLEEHFFLNHDDDFFVKRMYTAISSRARNTSTTNNIWMMFNPSVGIDSDRADSLSFFEPKQRKEVCVTLRQWAAFMGPRGAIHVNHLQAPCRAFFRWDLSWREHVNVTYSYNDSTRFSISACCSSGLRYGST
jgi:hypothetical protein